MKAITTILSVLAMASLTVNAADEPKKAKQDPEKVFSKKDANGDGKLSKEEFLKGAKDAEMAEKQFAARDKDSNGEISKDEFLAAPKKKKKD